MPCESQIFDRYLKAEPQLLDRRPAAARRQPNHQQPRGDEPLAMLVNRVEKAVQQVWSKMPPRLKLLPIQ
jgi:hypothetical protein